jgi:hypothetical protein
MAEIPFLRRLRHAGAAIRRGSALSSDAAAGVSAAHGGDPAYSYKPSLMGAAWEFRLRPDALEWRAGRHEGRIPYGRIARVRLSFRPVTMQTRRFVTEIWPARAGPRPSPGSHPVQAWAGKPRLGPKLSIASTSWRSLVEQGTQDQAYGAFISDLHGRIAAAHAPSACAHVSFETGSPAIVYWPGLAVFVGAASALAALTFRALQVGEWAGAAFVGGFLGLFAWQSGTYFRRNRPGRYRPDALPPELVPRRNAL